MLWPRVSEGTYRFDWPQRVANAMEAVTLADVQALLQAVLQPPAGGGPGRLLVLVHGRDHVLPSSDELAAKIGPVGAGGWARLPDCAECVPHLMTRLPDGHSWMHRVPLWPEC